MTLSLKRVKASFLAIIKGKIQEQLSLCMPSRQRRRRGIAALIINLGTKRAGVVALTTWLLYLQGRFHHFLLKGRLLSRCGEKSLAHTKVINPDCPAHSLVTLLTLPPPFNHTVITRTKIIQQAYFKRSLNVTKTSVYFFL